MRLHRRGDWKVVTINGLFHVGTGWRKVSGAICSRRKKPGVLYGSSQAESDLEFCVDTKSSDASQTAKVLTSIDCTLAKRIALALNLAAGMFLKELETEVAKKQNESWKSWSGVS